MKAEGQFTGGLVFVLAVGALAMLVPARMAMRTDPSVALRQN